MSKDTIEQYVSYHSEKCGGEKPIYRIMLFENPDKEWINQRGEATGYPDTGSMNDMGFYYELETAISAMHENWLDIQETVFHAGFILCVFPGLYQCAPDEGRIYFIWDKERGGFFESEEPEIFKHVAY